MDQKHRLALPMHLVVQLPSGLRSICSKKPQKRRLVGDTDPVPMAQRPEMRYVHAGVTAEEVLDRLAELIAERAGAIHPIFPLCTPLKMATPR
jgi:hypothetical protein